MRKIPSYQIILSVEASNNFFNTGFPVVQCPSIGQIIIIYTQLEHVTLFYFDFVKICVIATWGHAVHYFFNATG